MTACPTPSIDNLYHYGKPANRLSSFNSNRKPSQAPLLVTGKAIVHIILVSYPLVLLDGLVASKPRDLWHGVRLEDALHDEVVALLPDRRLLGEARWNAVGNAWFAAEITA